MLTLIGLISALFLAIFWYSDLSLFLIEQFKWHQALSNILSFVIIFIGVILFFRLLEIILSRITALLLLNWINILGGMLFGFIRGVIIVGILFFILNWIPVPEVIQGEMNKSFLAPFFIKGLAFIYESFRDWLPEHFQFDMNLWKEQFYHNKVIL